MHFTRNQERALDARHHLAVTANAGSGKTLVLVERYVRILLSGVPVSEVVALTYTEKAAGELKRKIAERVTAAIAGARDQDEAARLETIRDALPAAFVGTIHSFCSRLLHEFPVEADVDAAFSVLEKVDGEILLRGCASAVLREILDGAHTRVSRDQLMGILRDMGTSRVMAILLKLVGKREQRERLDGKGGVYNRTDAEILALWRETILAVTGENFSSHEFLADLSGIVDASGRAQHAQAAALHKTIGGEGDLNIRALAFEDLMQLMMNKDGSVSKRALADNKTAELLIPAVSRLAGKRKFLDPFVRFIATGCPDAGHRWMLETGRVLLALARSVIDEFSLRKEEESKLDFEDLQLKMRALLRHPGVRAGLARRFRYVMIDEFQDTNELQLDILLPMLENLSSGNLFIVGDPKQSIYRFRDADVGVFDRTRSAIVGAAGPNAHVALDESFRPLPALLAFVNLLFSHVMQPAGPARQEKIPYDPLVQARMDDASGLVEILLKEGGGGDEAGTGQEDLIARRILLLRSERHPVFGRDRQPRPAEFRDIAVLLRSRTRLEKIEQAFIRNGVPYVVSAGVGYFQTQDVYDVYNYLRFLLNTADDVALAGILRSPFFNVSDAELLRLARSGRGSTLWDALKRSGGLPDRMPSLDHAAKVLGDDLAIGVRLPASELLVRIIDQSHLRGALAGTVRGEQALANIDKLLRMAREYEAQGFTGLHDFVGRLRRLIDEEEREGQAAIESHTDAVQIMTVHAAKGLEFPVVVVPDLQRAFRFDEEPFVDDALGIGIGAGEAVPEDPPLLPYLKEKVKGKVREEEQRIFYVACTRARDVLLLAADLNKSQPPDSWLRWVQSCVERAGESLKNDRMRFSTLEVPVIHALPAQPAPGRVDEKHKGHFRLLVDPIPSRQRGEVFSASKIRTYIECPSKYHFRYVLGLKLGADPSVRIVEEELHDNEYPAELRGRVFHAVMEYAGMLTPEEGVIEKAVRGVLAQQAPFVFSSYPSLAADVTALVLGVISSPSWDEIAAGTEVKTEFSISAAFEDDFITGTIDRLYRGNDGTWTVLDFKTDTVSPGDVESRAEAYWSQLRFYALMVRKLFDVPVVRIRILFAALPGVALHRTLSTADLDVTAKEVHSVIQRIKRGEFPSPERPCNGCPYLPQGCTVLL